MDEQKPTREGSGLITRTIETALLPLHAAISKPAQRAYLGTFLFAATSILLLCVSSVAYTLFYYNYVPQNSVERVVHLQFGDGHPHGTTHLSTSLASLQPYDISLSLHLPRTPSNLAAGNFMLDLSLLSPTTATTTTTNPNSTIARSRRPAILTYASPLISTATTLSTLPLYILGLATESQTLTISMFESVSFPRGHANIPQRAHLVIEAEAADEDDHHQKMQFYAVSLQIIAKLGGLRWILYHHRVLSFLFFTTAFWSSSMVSMTVAWLAISTYLSPSSSTTTKREPNGTAIKRERLADSDAFDPTSMEDLSDTSRTFPTLSQQPPLHFNGRHKEIKKEEGGIEDEFLRSAELQPFAAEADDEEDDDDEISHETSGFRDSGIGTGLDDERLASVQRRRKALTDRRDSGV